jgi:hypothetical protein
MSVPVGVLVLERSSFPEMTVMAYGLFWVGFWFGLVDWVLSSDFFCFHGQ